jgi:hypothetical protein
MTDQSFVRELSSALAGLSPRQRDQLSRMLHDPTRRRAFQQLIDSALRLSNGSRSEPTSASTDDADAPVAVRGNYDEDSIWQSFASVFSDKDTFRATADVIDAARYFFNAKLDKRRFIKAGRRDAIAETWRQVCALPIGERSDRLRRFFTKFEHLLDPHRSYRELFRFLSRSE